MRGRDGNAHRGELAKGMLPMISHLGAMPSRGRRRAARAAPARAARLPRQLHRHHLDRGRRHRHRRAARGAQRGLDREAALRPDRRQQPGQLQHLQRPQLRLPRPRRPRRSATGCAAGRCDGTDAVDSLVAVGGAIAAARRGEGPQMVVASLLRLAGHGSHDDARYMPAELKARFGDGVELAQAAALAEGVIDQAGLDALLEELRALVRSAADTARAEADPDPERRRLARPQHARPARRRRSRDAWRPGRDHVVRRGDPRRARRRPARRSARVHLRPGHRRQLRRRVQGHQGARPSCTRNASSTRRSARTPSPAWRSAPPSTACAR